MKASVNPYSGHRGPKHPGAKNPRSKHRGSEHCGSKHPRSKHRGSKHCGSKHPGSKHPGSEHPESKRPGDLSIWNLSIQGSSRLLFRMPCSTNTNPATGRSFFLPLSPKYDRTRLLWAAIYRHKKIVDLLLLIKEGINPES
jgi:hypothetical protein